MEGEMPFSSRKEMRKDVLQFYRNRKKIMEERDKMVLKKLMVIVRKRSSSMPPSRDEKRKSTMRDQTSFDFSTNETSLK